MASRQICYDAWVAYHSVVLGTWLSSSLRESVSEHTPPTKATTISFGVISAHDPLVRLLRVAVPTPTDAIGGTRYTGNIINNVNIEDAYIYRMA